MTTNGTTPRFDLRVQPDANYLEDLAGGLLTILDRSRMKFRKQDSLYSNTYTIWNKNSQRPFYYTGKSSAIVRQAVDTQFAYDARVHREPVGNAENAQKLADELERWMSNLFQSVALNAHTPAIKMFNFHLILHGKGILEGPRFIEPKDGDDEPEREPEESSAEYEARVAAWRHDADNWNPFTMLAPHPGDVLCDPWARKPSEVIIRKTMYAYQLAALTERRRSLGRKVDVYTPTKRSDKVKLDEYFSRYWHILKLQGGDILVAERNTWGFVPFQQAYSTFGWEQTDESLSDPSDLCGGLLDNIADVLQSIDQNASASHEVNIRKAFASRVSKAGGAEGEEALRAAARGEDIAGASPADVGVLEYPDVGVGLRDEQDRLESYAVDGTYTPALLGIHQAGVKTLGEATINSRAASRKFQAIAENDASVATVFGENVLRLMDTFGEKVTMRGVTIDRAHIRHVYALEVEFDNADFLTQQQERADAREDYKNGLIDDETTLGRVGYEDVTKIRDRKIKQLARQDPRYIRKLVDGALQDMGMQAEDLGAPQSTSPSQGGQPVAPANPGGGPVLLGPNGQPLRAVQQAGQFSNPQQGLEQVRSATAPVFGGG